MIKVFNPETGEDEYYPDEITTKEGLREPEAEMPREERIAALQAIVERKTRRVEGGMTASQRQAKWRESHPEKHRVYMLNYMTRYRARRKAE